MLLNCLRHMHALNTLLIVHAENNDLVLKGIAEMQMQGRTDPVAHAESRPPIVETEAIRRLVHFAGLTRTRIHVAHVSTAGGVHAVREAREQGGAVTCETCPQYLLMDTRDLNRLGPFARCAPALRDPGEIDPLWEMVLAGHVDAIASDHSPYRIEEKESGYADIFQAKLGLNIIQTMLPAVLDEGIHRRGMTCAAFANLSAANPARILGLYPRKGSIRVGADADLALWDLNATWEVRRENLLSRHPWTPLEGRFLTGKVITTIRRGESIFHDGNVVGKPGDGEFLHAAEVPLAVQA
jgi:allantoinase